MADDALEIGVTPWSFAAHGGARHLTDQAERAEALGFHSFWLPESHFTGDTAIPSPLLWHAAVAARTERLRLGTTSLLLPIRHPIQIAEDVAVLDRLSSGRLILGVGRGFRKALFEAFDVRVAEKRDLFDAALAVMREAWDGEPVAADGDTPGPPATLSPLPFQRPHPPIWVAAFGPKALAQAGRLGLPYLASPVETFDRLVENYSAHREALASHDFEGGLAVPIMRSVFIHRNSNALGRVRDALTRQARGMARAAAAVIRRASEAEVEDWAIVGEPNEVADAVARYREKLGMTHMIVRTQMPGADEGELLGALDELAALGA